MMTLLIAIGAIMVFMVWNQSKKRQQKIEERRQVEESTGKLKQEIEKTANEVIGRMESQVSSLEDLLDESEKNRTILEGRVAELRKLLKRSEGQSTEIRDLLVKLEEAGDTVEELQRKLDAADKKIAMAMSMPMQMPMQPTMMPMTTPMMTPMMTPPMMTAPLPNVPSPISPPPILSTRQKPTTPSTSKTSLTAQNKDDSSSTTTKANTNLKKTTETADTSEAENNEAKDFEKMLKKSMSNNKTDVKTPLKAPDRRSIVVPSRQRAAAVVDTEPVKIESQRKNPEDTARLLRAASEEDASNNKSNPRNEGQGRKQTSDSIKIKNMLLDGMSVEDIARETGIGRGAIELVQEMTRRQLERKN